ncbi:MAG: hypothetical protein ABW049_10010 [Spongiibacteraceae bacterium]
MMSIKTTIALKTFGASAIAALLLSAPLAGTAAEAVAQSSTPSSKPTIAGTASCNSVMNKTKEFRDAPKEQIEGICKTNRNSPAYWSCMNTRIDKGQGFADAGMRCNKITASR